MRAARFRVAVMRVIMRYQGSFAEPGYSTIYPVPALPGRVGWSRLPLACLCLVTAFSISRVFRPGLRPRFAAWRKQCRML